MRASPYSTSQNLHTGDRVRVRGCDWRIVDIRAFEACALVDLAGVAVDNAAERARLLTPFDRPRPIDGAAPLRSVRRQRARLALAALAASGTLRAAPYAAIDILPHQLDPALTLLCGGASRILVADEVGLGKTIQAAVAIAELMASGRAARVLILTPAGIREQWIDELRSRFGIDAALVDAAALRTRMASIPRAVNPWHTWPVAVVSTDFVKRAHVITPAADGAWDVLVVDEAHTAAAAPDRRAAVDRLARAARYVVLLTATPHNGDDRAYTSLCALGRVWRREAREEDGELVVFRRTRRDAGIPVNRRVHLLRVTLAAIERQMHRALDQYVRRVVAEARRRNDSNAVLAMIVLTKRALSGPFALERSIDRRITLLARADRIRGVQMALPLAAADPDLDPADEAPDALLACAGLDDALEEGVWLDRLRAIAVEAAGADSKVRAVRTLLRRAREPLIVFTEYRDTLSMLEQALAAFRPTAIHGGIDARERSAIVERFRRGDVPVLLATDVACEGLNLHTACRLVVSLELPWTPARLEQRIGRVDRIGQRRRVHAFNLLARGTAETEVLTRLVRRLDVMRRRLGEIATPLGPVSDEAILDASLGIPHQATVAASAPPVLPAAIRHGRGHDRTPASRDEAARIERWRALWTRVRGRCQAAPRDVIAELDRSAPWIAIERRPTVFVPGVLALFRTRVPLGQGRAYEEALIALHVPHPHAFRSIPPGAARRLVRALLPALTERAGREIESRSRALWRRTRAWRERAARRESAIAAAVRARHTETQGRLFQRCDAGGGVERSSIARAAKPTARASMELLLVVVLASR